MKYDKNTVTKRYNLRRLRDRPYYSSLETSKIHKPKLTQKQNLLKESSYGWSNFNTITNSNDWVSATKVKNYLLKDPVIDWLDLNNKTQLNPSCTISSNHQNIFFEMGIKFENEVINYLRKDYPDVIKKVVTNQLNISLNDVTLQYMKEGIPIIEQAALYNLKNKTFGVADILIRSDWINKLFTVPVLSTNEETYKALHLNGDYHYRVIDIKWTTLYLCNDGKLIRNSHRTPAYKGQLAIYNAALGILQGYTPNEAYILAKSWNINNGKDDGYNCFTRLGCIDYKNFDNKYLQETNNAIKWVRNVRQNGSQWTYNNPSVPELYPNMCNKYDAPYHNIKKDMAKELNELTMIYMVGTKNRAISHSKKIYSWKDKRCNSKNLGINGPKIGPIVDKIIKINRDPGNNIEPLKIKNNMQNWQKHTYLDFYVDFETVSETLYNKNINILNSKNEGQLLFLIGVGYKRNNKWSYNKFLVNKIELEDEKTILTQFVTFIENETLVYMKSNKKNRNECTPRFFHWSHAEKTIFNAVNKRHNNIYGNWNVEWIDIYKVFIDEQIVVKGSTKYTLKDISYAMKSHGMIQSVWASNGPNNGLEAMLDAINYYQTMEISNESQIQVIVNYNEIDCKTVCEIVSYLREYHC